MSIFQLFLSFIFLFVPMTEGPATATMLLYQSHQNRTEKVVTFVCLLTKLPNSLLK